jgi:hypothetical protein
MATLMTIKENTSMFSARGLLAALAASAALLWTATAPASGSASASAWQSESLHAGAPAMNFATSSDPEDPPDQNHGEWPRPVGGEPGGGQP